MDMLLLLPAVNYGSCLSPLPFPAPFQHSTALYSRPLQNSYFEVNTDTKHAWSNILDFMQQQKTISCKTANCAW